MEYGLIGEHLGHSFSKQIHNALGNDRYILQEIPRDQVEDFFRNREFSGINVTIPYKKTALAACEEVSELAAKAQAVNCVINRNGRLYGDNTDCAGILATLNHAGVTVRDKTVLILGRGGAATAVQAVIESLGGQAVTVYRKPAEGCILPEDAFGLHPEAALVINATPAGMYPDTDSQALDLSGFRHLEFVFDLVYNPLKTNLLLQAEAMGIPHDNGLRMLVTQAIRAHELFFDVRVPDEIAEQVLSDLIRQRENIVLTGMSSCGKSTLGKLLAGKLGLKFTDLDEEIEAAAGMSIPEIFRQEQEAGFRKRETEAACRAGLETGQVIACGGGIIERPENRDLLRRNGMILWLKRNPDLMIHDDPGRPMLKQGFESLYQRRAPVYQAWADLTVSNNGTALQGLEAVCRALVSRTSHPASPQTTGCSRKPSGRKTAEQPDGEA